VTLRLTVGEGVAAGGDALARLPDGRVVFVEGALPGERVVAEVVEQRRDYARARTLDVLDPHPGRLAPPCPNLAAGCGGCQLLHADAPTQRGIKELIVADALTRIGRVPDPPALRHVALPTEGYRTTVHLAVGADGRPSYRRRHGCDPVGVDSCLVAHPRLEELIVAGRFPGQRRVTLRVGVAGGERLALVSRRPAAPPRLPADVRVVGPGGTGHVHEHAGGRRWRVSARSFFQPGPAAADALAAAVDEALGPPVGPVADLYAGVGLLGGVAAARRRVPLVAVESNPAAAADARRNLADLDAVVFPGEVGRWRPRPVAAVIADPARPGLGRPGVAALGSTGASVAAVVHCDVASFARDVGLLREAGWELRSVTVLDAFPHTVHVEVVSRLERDRSYGGELPPVS
jgi:23S rRNA (uracil1939-C5)-methyltransferase